MFLTIIVALAGPSCANWGQSLPPTDAIVIEAYRSFGRGDCASVRAKGDDADWSQADAARRSLFRILDAYCLELVGESGAARAIYSAIIGDVPRSTLAYDASLRLQALDRPDGETYEKELLERRQMSTAGLPAYDPAAKVIHRIEPAFPEVARAAEIEGRVLVDFAIAPNGDVRDPEVLASEPQFLFDGAALAAVRHWIYEPTATPADRRARVVVNFHFGPVVNR